jgi:hypothetical protein
LKIRKLSLRPAGMFSNVNEVVQQLHLAKQSGYVFIIDWSRSCYFDPNRLGDPWEYYFEQCFDVDTNSHGDMPTLPGGAPVACSQDNIITPRLDDGCCDPLLLPRDRNACHALINKYIVPKPLVRDEIEGFAGVHFDRPIIGLHIRGAGRTDGGVPALRAKYSLEDGVPYGLYFEAVSRALSIFPEGMIFVCSDSSRVIERVISEFGNRVICYESTRSEFGEMHANHKKNHGVAFPKYKLGLDVVVEAHLLAKTDFFIHGNSNVANFVLCRRPEIDNSYVYEL